MASPNDDLVAAWKVCSKQKARAVILAALLRQGGARGLPLQMLKTEVDNYMKVVDELPLT